MRIAHFIPAYRQTIRVQAAYSLVHDMLWAQANEHSLIPFFTDMGHIGRARNWAIKRAMEAGIDRILMQDSDVWAPAGALEQLSETMEKTRATAVGALVMTRSGQKMNAEPAKPGEVYEGEVGTGLMLIDLVRMRNVAPPWFEFVHSEDGSEVVCGEDIWFCRLLQKFGHKVVVDARIPTNHAGETTLDYQPPVAANLAEVDALSGRNRPRAVNAEGVAV